MWPVLIANIAWVLILGFWCVLYFVQAKADRAKATGGRRS
jgi:uncharacterized membrane protein YccF (DUF307 family)